MNHPTEIVPGIAGSMISAVCSLTFLGVSLLEKHPVVSDIAVVLSISAALFSITSSSVTIYKNLRSK